jgi:hypothetical protein
MKFSQQTKSRSIFGLIALLTIFFGLQSANVRGQSAGFEAGLAGQMSNVLGAGILSNASSANAIEIATRNRGLAKIKSGKATTTFVHSSDIYRYILDYIIFDETEPKTESGRMKLLQEQVSRFEARMVKAGFKVNDSNDAAIFACMLSYEAYHDQKLTPAMLEKFHQYHQLARQNYLNDARFQGSLEQEKEKLYILDAIMSIQAIESREEARAARTSAARQEADEKAKHHAEYKMKVFSFEELRELAKAEKPVN